MNIALPNIDIKTLLLNMGSISGLILLPYSITQAAKRKPHFKFDFYGTAREAIEKSNTEYYRFSFNGTVKNKSTEPNYITKFYLVVWANKNRTAVHRIGFGQNEVKDLARNEIINTPIRFEGKECKQLGIIFEIPFRGSSDERLLTTFEPAGATFPIQIPKYTYELCFEDTNEFLFDQQGNLRNIKEINLRWILPNTMKSLQEGNALPFLKHILQIAAARVSFSIKRMGYYVGL